MYKTIRSVLSHIDHQKTSSNPEGNPFFINGLSVDEALAEIERLLEEAKPKYQTFTRNMVSRGEVKDKINEYLANIERILK